MTTWTDNQGYYMIEYRTLNKETTFGEANIPYRSKKHFIPSLLIIACWILDMQIPNHLACQYK